MIKSRFEHVKVCRFSKIVLAGLDIINTGGPSREGWPGGSCWDSYIIISQNRNVKRSNTAAVL